MKSIISALFIFISIFLHAQGSYKVVFEGTARTTTSSIVATKQDEFIAVMMNYPFITSKVNYTDIYTFNNNIPDDTVRWGLNFNRSDSALSIRDIHIEPDGGYLLSGIGVHYSYTNTLVINSRFNWMMRLDEMKNVLWEKILPLPVELSDKSLLYYFNFLALESGHYLFAESVQNDTIPWIINILLVETNPQGEVLRTKVFDKTICGDLMSLTYNHDSSSILLHKMHKDLYDCANGIGAFILDTANYDTIGRVCYRINNNNFTQPYKAMIYPQGDLIVAGGYHVGWPDPNGEYLGVKRYDTAYQLLFEARLTDPDTLIYAAWEDCLDINSQGEICVAGSFDDPPGFYTDYYNSVYIAKLDPELNLISERYIGLDAEYSAICLATTSDGGVAVGGYQYDYLVNEDNEGDAFIIKTDGGLWLDVPQVTEENVHRAWVYPNPGNNELNIRTTVSEAVFRLYNLNGILLIEQPVNQLITTIITSSLPQGAYWWTLSKHGQIADKGKWIKY